LGHVTLKNRLVEQQESLAKAKVSGEARNSSVYMKARSEEI